MIHEYDPVAAASLTLVRRGAVGEAGRSGAEKKIPTSLAGCEHRVTHPRASCDDRTLNVETEARTAGPWFVLKARADLGARPSRRQAGLRSLHSSSATRTIVASPIPEAALP